jgi:hypothetical protein
VEWPEIKHHFHWVTSNGVKLMTNFKKDFSLVEKFFEVMARANTSTDVNWREITLGSTGIVGEINV